MIEILHEAWLILFPSLLGLCGVVGIAAMVSPKLLTLVAQTGGIVVAQPKNESKFKASVDIDQFIIRHSREFGSIVTLVTIYLTLFFFGYIDQAWTPYFLLFIIGVMVCMTLSGLLELGGQVTKIEHQLAEARIDVLTGLPNRRALDEELERRLAELSRTHVNFGVAILDIDHFKQINDTHGHITGDTVLCQGVAEVIQNSNRTMDLAARYGGEEFVIIYPTCNLAQATAFAEGLRLAIEANRIPFEERELSIGVSIGVAEASSADTVATLLDRADKALYAAKQAGRNQVFQHDGKACQPLKQD